MKAQEGYYCSGSPDSRTRCRGFCASCGYGKRDAYGRHKNEEYYVPRIESNPTFVPSYCRPFISDNDLESGKVELF